MEILLALLVFLGIVTLLGHGIWLILAFFFRLLLGSTKETRPDKIAPLSLAEELRITARTLRDLRAAGELDDKTYYLASQAIQRNLTPRAPQTEQWQQVASTPAPAAPPSMTENTDAPAPSVAPAPSIADVINAPWPSPAPMFSSVTADVATPAPEALPKPEPRRAWTESLAAFMEQGNIRWGEIVGGLLIIGCSTALVISLWTQISQVPALKFFLFTLVTAAIFGVGLYTEHRWKLPTTSHGILTIAVLLVPLNFLAMAAVTGESAALIVVSELFAPALFLFLVYRAGCVLTPDWRWLLALSVLGSSIGQLLVRHLAGPGAALPWLYFLGAFPLLCYLCVTVVMLRRADADQAVTDDETTPIFITLGATTFAAALPCGLLLYKSGAVNEAMMRLAPLLTLFGVPLLACGLLLWRRINDAELKAERTAGASLALLGGLVAVAGLAVAWPNPFSVVLAALALFGIATTIARFFALPHAHTLAGACVALAYLVAFNALAGYAPWQAAPDFSLLAALNHIRSGQILAPLFFALIIAAEWQQRRTASADGKLPLPAAAADSYLLTAGAVAALSFALVTAYGLRLASDPHGVTFIYAFYAASAAWLAWRRKLAVLTWLASGLALMAFMQLLTAYLDVASPWQAAMLTCASLAAGGALYAWGQGPEARRIFTAPLYVVALACSVAAGAVFLQAWDWQSVPLVAFRLFWLAAIFLGLTWLRREAWLFTTFQVLLTCAVLVTVKVFLRQFAWYARLPHGTLHPWSLQIYGIALLLLSLGWLAVRRFRGRWSVIRGQAQPEQVSFMDEEANDESSKTQEVVGAPATDQRSLTTDPWLAQWSFDRLIPPAILLGLACLSLYGAWTGVKLELARQGVISQAFNLGGFAHEHALGAGSWTLLGLLVVTLLASYYECGLETARRARLYILGVIVALWCAAPLLAGLWEAQFATATAFRWLAALFLLGAAASSKQWAVRSKQQPENSLVAFRKLVLLLCLLPLLALTIFPAWRAVWYVPAHGPMAGLFGWLSATASYSLPLALATLALAVWAVRGRAADLALGAAGLALLAVNVAHVFALSSANLLMNRVALAQAAQWNAMAAAMCALLWLATRERWRPDATESQRYLRWLLGFGVAVNAALIIPIFLRIFTQPTWTSIGVYETGRWRGWLALLLISGAVLWFGRIYRLKLNAYAVCATSLAACVLAASSVARLDLNREWHAYHALLFGAVATLWAMIALRLQAFRVPSLDNDRQSVWSFGASWAHDTTRCAWAVGGLAFVLAWRGILSDPLRPWWTCGVLVILGLLAAELNWQTLRRGYLYVAGILFNLAATIGYFTILARQTGGGDWGVWLIYVPLAVNVIVVALAGLAWLFMELRAQKITGSDIRRAAAPTAHSLAMLTAILLLGLLAGLHLLDYLLGTHEYNFTPEQLSPHAPVWLLGLAVAAAVALAAAILWEGGARYPVFALYCLGLISLALAVDLQGLRPTHFYWAGALAAACYTLATSLVWRRRVAIQVWLGRWGVPPRTGVPEGENVWLRVTNLLLALSVGGVACVAVLTYGAPGLRWLIALALAAQVFTFGLLANKESGWQRWALAFLALGAVFLGWAYLGPAATWLDRTVALMLAQLVLVAGLAWGAPRWFAVGTGWRESVQSVLPVLAVICLTALAFALGDEVQQQVNLGFVNTNTPTLLLVSMTLLAACAMAIFVALRGEFDPLKLSERGRMAYVYAAEVLLALLFMHTRLTLPWLFSGRLQRYWPYVVVVLAYAGVALSEMLQRRRVLAEPLARTGIFLPLIPVLGYWVVNSRADYSWLLFAVGAFYGVLSILRKSLGFGVLAALTVQGGVWHALAQTQTLGLGQHPQLWLIPLGLCFLAGAHLNRAQFNETQMAAIRYGATGVIYVSSTADIFLNGVAEAPWLPLVLAAFAIAGVFCGIFFRVRAFLLLGVTFLLIAVLTMIYYASSNLGWTWIWWVVGILTGAAIIFVFALFEKKKSEMLRVMDDLRAWES